MGEKNDETTITSGAIARKLEILRARPGYIIPFRVIGRKVIDQVMEGTNVYDATFSVQIYHDDEYTRVVEVASGEGPLDSLHNVIVKALRPYFPCIEDLRVESFISHGFTTGLRGEVEVILHFERMENGWAVEKFSESCRSISIVTATECVLLRVYEFFFSQFLQRKKEATK